MDTMITSLTTIFDRDIRKLEQEIKLYPDDGSVWKVDGAIKNPGGNLCLHLCGNLQHYIGNILGNTGYKRDREFEFSARGLPLQKLFSEVEQTQRSVVNTLKNLDVSVLDKQYPEDVFGHPMTTSYFLIHLAAHLGYHLGQINYHRRLLSGT